MKLNKKNKIIISILILLIIILVGYLNYKSDVKDYTNNTISYDITNIPEYNNEIYIVINENKANFSEEDINIKSDYYSDLVDKRVRNVNDKNLLGKS